MKLWVETAQILTNPGGSIVGKWDSRVMRSCLLFSIKQVGVFPGSLPVRSSWFCEKVQDTLQNTGLWGTVSWWALISPALILLQERNKLISRVSLFSKPDRDTIESRDANSSVLSRRHEAYPSPRPALALAIWRYNGQEFISCRCGRFLQEQITKWQIKQIPWHLADKAKKQPGVRFRASSNTFAFLA